ncbi:MAG: NifB/NifX family molybdenum-iron cluster-binding protein [Dehalococcoidales bacterium]|jgi:predicted Fe-Mo cluster-binding NifX family protein|nr:NifB/NifX family molybdenum-iron cluster-binding protein [Dehalococcoidales bacterium]
MKFAIPVSNGCLSAHFGQTTEFSIMEVDDSKQIVGRETLSALSHDCHGTPVLLAERGVNVVLAGGMGMGPRMAFENNGVEVILGVTETNPETAVIKYLYHRLESGENVCDHGDTVCDHGGQHEEHNGGCH